MAGLGETEVTCQVWADDPVDNGSSCYFVFVSWHSCTFQVTLVLNLFFNRLFHMKIMVWAFKKFRRSKISGLPCP